MSALSPPDLTSAEVYVRSLSMASNIGLPCWQPEPSALFKADGVLPGDVGTFSAEDGFKKIFNLWDDAKSIRMTQSRQQDPAGVYHPPKRNILRTENVLREGETVPYGVHSETTPYMLPDGTR